MNVAQRASIYASSPAELPDSLRDSYYHVTDLPDGSVTSGWWDLRENVDAYLGGVDLAGKSVLEIGPASGFLTKAMEDRGADVTAIEIPDEAEWDYVPYPSDVLAPHRAGRRASDPNMKKTWWYTRRAFDLKARMVYAHATNLPPIGPFDVAVCASVLLHTACPHLVLAECAKRANTVVVTEMAYGLTGPVMRLVPRSDSGDFGNWWHFAPEFFTQYLAVMGLSHQRVTEHQQRLLDSGTSRMVDHYTVIASRMCIPT